MKSQNEWYLVKVEKVYIQEINSLFLRCYYSNGLRERTIEVKHGEEILTIVGHERLG
jgi:hypothetical protein